MRYLSAGESHGPGLVAIIEGLPSNLELNIDKINYQLSRRQKGYGRGGRMKIEMDRVEILSGLRRGKTLGSPLTLLIKNKDYDNWKEIMNPYASGEEKDNSGKLTRPRPGHADLVGALKYNHRDIRNVLERASARETAVRVAVGSVARELLACFGVIVYGHVVEIGGIRALPVPLSPQELQKKAEDSPVRCPDPQVETKMIREIDRAREQGDSLGGVFEILAAGVPAGLGSYAQWDRKLDGRIAGALMSLQAVKGVEIGLGFKAAALKGSKVHDEIKYDKKVGYYRSTNRAGGIEGGMSSGETIMVRCAMKPIPTLYQPLESVDMETKEIIKAGVERADVCAVPAACVVGEAITAWELACAFREKFSGDSVEEVLENYRGYLKLISKR